MKIRNKVAIIMFTSLLFLIIISYIVINKYLLANLKHTEINTITYKLNECETLIRNNILNLEAINRDWSAWNDTLDFVKNKNKNYIDTNLNESTLGDLNLNIFVILDNNKNIKYIKYYDSFDKNNSEMPKSLLYYIEKEKNLLCNHENLRSSTSALICIDGRPAIISSLPITDSTYKTPKAGALIMGRFLDKSFIEMLQGIFSCNISIKPITSLQKSDTGLIVNNVAFNKSASGIIKTNVFPANENIIKGYSILKGVDSSPLLLLELQMDRSQYKEGVRSLKLFSTLLVLCTFILFIICNILLKIFIIYPIEDISNGIKNINLKNNFFNKLKVKRNDEIGNLAQTTNNMLIKIEDSNKIIYENEKQLSMVLQGANAGFWDWNIKYDYVNLSKRFYSILGYEPEEIHPNLKFLTSLIHEEDLAYFSSLFKQNLSKIRDSVVIEHRVLTKGNKYKWILTQGKVVEYDSCNNPIRMAGIITDIDDKKLSEEQLKYLTYYDKLTGAFNRGYYEYNLSKLNHCTELPISIIIGDINGLKITNDTFGHEQGDKLLKEAANILKSSIGSSGLVYRWGGDEFVIILKNTDETMAEDICKRIKLNCKDKDIQSIKVNIALGYATKYTMNTDLNCVIKEAEEKMYRNKLLEGESCRNSIIASLTKTLWEKSHETEEHGLRIYSICERIGTKLSLTSSQLDDLYILAKLHDIGKIAIPDHILNKPGPLTDKEWEVMKTHSEIGYRIACSSQDLNPIAYEILTHHERYDGTGYPKGLKGEKIPLLSRLLSIVDSFDVMIHDRPYKKALSFDEAIEELRRHAGTQFDPDLVEICIEVFQELTSH
ncbi:HD domain-containing phosphohydrolase [Clostridium lundense]|uniref:HD domain-containing phosphohydrolase n=1 Tax=Clostridium lundense TaxID=319475 RepID=UPI000684B052|nr:HD domain-containing phosphohydrolase [Clostridium lundense]